MAVVYHWKHGWVPLDHEAALSKAKGNHERATAYLAAAHGHDSGIRNRRDVAGALIDLPNVSERDRESARRQVLAAAEQHGATDLIPGRSPHRIEATSSRLVRERKPLHDEIDRQDHLTAQQKQIAHSIVDNWSARTNHPHVAVARDHQGRIVGLMNYDKPTNARGNRPGELDIHDLRAFGERSGAGSALVQHAREVGKRENRRVRVYNAVEPAIPFYERTGATGFRDSAGGPIRSHVGEWPRLP